MGKGPGYAGFLPCRLDASSLDSSPASVLGWGLCVVQAHCEWTVVL